jgi:hypothetical protein
VDTAGFIRLRDADTLLVEKVAFVPAGVIGILDFTRFGGRVSDRNYAASSNCSSYAAGLM